MSTEPSVARFARPGVVRDLELRYRLRAMTRLFVCLATSFVLSACGDELRSKRLDEPCTRTSQCVMGLVCLAGVCSLQPDGGSEPTNPAEIEP